MDQFGDGKVLLCLLVWLAVSSAANLGPPKDGYVYKGGAPPSGGLNAILKAVLVHESTGHGLHEGSISGQADGHSVTVMRPGALGIQSNGGYSYSRGRQMHGHQQQSGMQNIHVFHKSLGDTGNIRQQGLSTPQVQVVKVIRDYRPPQGQGSYNAIKREFATAGAVSQSASTGQSLRYIHEAALSRPSFFLPTVIPPEGPKSGHSYPNAQQNPSNGYQYPQPSTQGFQFNQNQVPQLTPNVASGYQYQSPGQQAEVSSEYRQPQLTAAAPVNFNSGYRLESPRSPGYSYKAPAPIQNGGAEQIAISHYESSAVQPASQGYRYDQPQQPPAPVPQFIEPSNKPNSGGYHYSNHGPMASQASGPAQAENDGYHYDRPAKSFDYEKPAVTKSTFKGQPYLPMPTAGLGLGYGRSPPPRTGGYHYERPNSSDSPKPVFRGPSYLPLPPASGSW